MTFLPAVVTITDLPTGTTLTGSELLEAVQTAGGVGLSIQLPVSQIWGPGTVIASTGLASSGSTTVALSLATVTGLCVIGNTLNATAVPSAITGTADQVMIINHAGSSAVFGAVNLSQAAAVTGQLPLANMATIAANSLLGNNTNSPIAPSALTSFQVSGRGVLFGNITTGNNTAPVSGGTSSMGFLMSSNATFGLFCGTGVPTMVAATGSLYINSGAQTATSRLYINTNGSTNWANFTASA